MFDDLERAIREAAIPDALKVALRILSRSISWLAWAFFLIGLFLTPAYLPYWLAFFMFVEGMLIAALVYVLVSIVKYSLAAASMPTTPATPAQTPSERDRRNDLFSAAGSGIVGNVAFYMFLLCGMIVLKAMGAFDALWGSVLTGLGHK